MSSLKNPVQMAVIGAPHGVKGELRVKTFTGDPLALGDYGPLFTGDGRSFDVVAIRPAGTVAVVKFRQVQNREQAEALNGAALFVEREALPADLDEGEFYHADLIGLAVKDETGNRLGKITAVHNYGGGDILEIMLGGRKTAMIPFTEAAVPGVDIAEGIIRIDSVAAGLVEDEAEESITTSVDLERRPRGPKQVGGNR